MFYHIYNDGIIPQLACGHRSVLALKPGRKWIVLCDWTTLETAKVPLETWKRMRPTPAAGYKPSRIRKIMQERLRITTGEKNLRSAMTRASKPLRDAFALLSIVVLTGCAGIDDTAPKTGMCLIWAGTFALPMPCGERTGDAPEASEQ